MNIEQLIKLLTAFKDDFGAELLVLLKDAKNGLVDIDYITVANGTVVLRGDKRKLSS